MTDDDVQAERYREYLEYYDAPETPLSRAEFDMLTQYVREAALKARVNHEGMD